MDGYNFSWNQLGDVKDGRPNLGEQTTVTAYRLTQYTMRAVLEKEYGEAKTKELLAQSGRVAGQEFCKNILDSTLPFNKFIAQLHDALIELSIGILKVEKKDMENMSFTFTVSEDLDCSGLPIKGIPVCDYDEGFLEGIFKIYTGKKFIVKEVDCWTTGGRTCRFTLDLEK